jgi:hypothetical protein
MIQGEAIDAAARIAQGTDQLYSITYARLFAD